MTPFMSLLAHSLQRCECKITSYVHSLLVKLSTKLGCDSTEFLLMLLSDSEEDTTVQTVIKKINRVSPTLSTLLE